MKLLLLCVCVALAHATAPLRLAKSGELAVPDSWIIGIKVRLPCVVLKPFRGMQNCEMKQII